MNTAGQKREAVKLPTLKLSPAMWLCVAVLLVIAFIGSSYYLWTVVSHGYKSMRLYAGHEIATGVVTADIIDGGSTYYEVEINGQTFTGITSEQLRKGAIIDVAYLAASPNINRPSKSLWSDVVGFGFVIAVLSVVLLLIINSKYLSKKDTHDE